MEKLDNLQNNDSLLSSQKKQKETIFSWIWRKTHKTEPPYYYYYSIWIIITKPIRKFFSAVLIPTIPFSNLRVACYRLCGYKIGKNVFIGMRCYLDDTQYKCIKIEDNVVISYGVYFACHGEKQTPHKLIIRKGAYIGMHSNIVVKKDIEIGEGAIIGAGSLINKSIPAGKTAAGVPVRLLD